MLATRVPILGIAIAVGLLVVETLGAIAYRDQPAQPSTEERLVREVLEHVRARREDPRARWSHPCGQLAGTEAERNAYRACTRRRQERARQTLREMETHIREMDAQIREIDELRQRAAELDRTRCGLSD